MAKKKLSKEKVLASFKENDYWRLLLAEQRKMTSFPDLLLGQKKWFEQFVNYYIHQLFKEVTPIEYTAWDQKIVLTVSDITLEPANITIEEAKRTEKNYSGILKWRLKLVNETEGKVLFDKVVNIAMLPLLTPNYSYIINWVERVIVSQIVKFLKL